MLARRSSNCSHHGCSRGCELGRARSMPETRGLDCGRIWSRMRTNTSELEKNFATEVGVPIGLTSDGWRPSEGEEPFQEEGKRKENLKTVTVAFCKRRKSCKRLNSASPHFMMSVEKTERPVINEHTVTNTVNILSLQELCVCLPPQIIVD